MSKCWRCYSEMLLHAGKHYCPREDCHDQRYVILTENDLEGMRVRGNLCLGLSPLLGARARLVQFKLRSPDIASTAKIYRVIKEVSDPDAFLCGIADIEIVSDEDQAQ